VITEEVGDSGSWLHDPDTGTAWDDGDFDDGTEYTQFWATRINVDRNAEFNITHMPLASAFAFPTEERVARITFTGIVSDLTAFEKVMQFWIKHTDFSDNDVYMIILDNTESGNQYYQFYNSDRVARDYIKGKFIKVLQNFDPRRREYTFNGIFEGVWD
jgi:hypothetical protein